MAFVAGGSPSSRLWQALASFFLWLGGGGGGVPFQFRVQGLGFRGLGV